MDHERFRHPFGMTIRYCVKSLLRVVYLVSFIADCEIVGQTGIFEENKNKRNFFDRPWSIPTNASPTPILHTRRHSPFQRVSRCSSGPVVQRSERSVIGCFQYCSFSSTGAIESDQIMLFIHTHTSCRGVAEEVNWRSPLRLRLSGLGGVGKQFE